MSEWSRYVRKGYSEMRKYVEGEDMTGISISDEDAVAGLTGGYVARNPENHKDQWFVAKAWVEANYIKE